MIAKMARSETKKRLIKLANREGKLRVVAAAIAHCTKCNHTLRCPGYGSPLSRTMIVGQSLHGRSFETKYFQVPFIGPIQSDSGDVLFRGIEHAGVMAERLWITNIVKCHPPHNAPNTAEWTENCWQFFLSELKIIKPRTIIALGKQAYIKLIDSAVEKKRVSRNRYPYHKVKFENGVSTRLWWTYHPSYAMRKGAKNARLWENSFGMLLAMTRKGER